MALTWFRYHADALDNPRVQKLDPFLFKLWVNIQCILAHEKSSASGKLPSVKEVAFRLRMSVEDTVRNLDLLVDAGLLKFKTVTECDEIGDESVTVGDGNGTQKLRGFCEEKKEYFLKNWEKKQYKSDSSTERTRQYRERHRNVTGTPSDQIRSETEQIRSEVGNLFDQGSGKEEAKTLKPRPTPNWDVIIFLRDEDRAKFRRETDGDDVNYWAPKFNDFIINKAKEYPKHPGGAFIAWVKKCRENDRK